MAITVSLIIDKMNNPIKVSVQNELQKLTPEPDLAGARIDLGFEICNSDLESKTFKEPGSRFSNTIIGLLSNEVT